MALASTTVFEVRTGGSDNSAGGYNPSRSGSSTDRSQSDTAYKSGTNLTVDATTNTDVAPDGYTPDATADPGNLIQITAGAGFTQGFYEIVSIQSGKWRLDRSPAATGTSGGTWAMGGALASPGKVAGAVVAGNTVWIKTGTYSITSASTNIAGGCWAAAVASLLVEGYQTTRGDLGTAPTLQASGISTFTLFDGNQGFSIFRNLVLDGNSLTSSRGLKLGNSRAELILAKNCTNNGILGFSSGSVQIRCRATGCSSQPAISPNGIYVGCEAYANTVTGFSVGSTATFISCIASGNSGASSDGFAATASNQFFNCVSYGNGRDGFRFTNNQHVEAINCIAEGNSGWGFNAATNCAFLWLCATYNNASGGVTISGTRVENVGPITGTASFFVDAGNGNFALNTTAGGGAAARAVGYPGVFPRGTTTGYLDIGAAQHADPIKFNIFASPVVQAVETSV